MFLAGIQYLAINDLGSRGHSIGRQFLSHLEIDLVQLGVFDNSVLVLYSKIIWKSRTEKGRVRFTFWARCEVIVGQAAREKTKVEEKRC